MPNWSKTFVTFRPPSLAFAIQKLPKNLNLQNYLPLIDPLVDTSNQTRAPMSRTYVFEQAIEMPNWSKTFQTLRSHSSIFALEKEPKNLIFQRFFTSNRPFGDYFQWNACTDFQKICSWTRYTDAKLIKTFVTFSQHSLVFAIEKVPKNLNFQSFLHLADTLVATFNETRAPVSRKPVAEKGIVMPNWSKNFQAFRSHSSVFATEKQLKI